MSELVALSFDAEASPSITLAEIVRRPDDRDLPYGWGFGWYPSEDPVAVVIKDPTATGDDPMTRVLRDWERFRSTIFLCHIRGKQQRISQADAQPFIRSHARRHWLLAHSGDLSADLPAAFPAGERPAFEPLGRTDSEYVLCWILSRAHEEGLRSLAELGYERLHGWCRRLNQLGTLNLLLTDGTDLAVYSDEHGAQPLHCLRLLPPHTAERFESRDLVLELDTARDPHRTLWIAATQPLSGDAWTRMQPGQLAVVRRGLPVWSSHAEATGEAPARRRGEPPGPAPLTVPAGTQVTPQAQAGLAPPQPAPAARPERVLRVVHETRYTYSDAVQRSSHRFRLRPVVDEKQQLLEHSLEISADGARRDFEDVFGNRTTMLEVATPFNELSILSQSLVRVFAEDPLDAKSPVRRDSIPLVWMPWQRQMMLPYLLPPELPESELRELSNFAMSFVERNDYDLLESLLDINTTLYRDIQYLSGSTDLETTPFQVYASRRGVCQDFANLMICMARLLNVPARYRMGYIWTGADYRNRIQSDASHAWVELYLPWIGWHGFDPTNGCQVNCDHVRVACGRNFRDATPTSGTIYRGGVMETLSLIVRVEEAEPPS